MQYEPEIPVKNYGWEKVSTFVRRGDIEVLIKRSGLISADYLITGFIRNPICKLSMHNICILYRIIIS